MKKKESNKLDIDLLEATKKKYSPPFTDNGYYSLNQIYQYINLVDFSEKIREYSCTVVIPVFNGYDHLLRLIPSLAKNTECNIKVIFVDDCSTDSRILPLLKEVVNEHACWVCLENENNLGFVATVNYAMENVTTDFAILLNTDTEVPSKWIEKMLYPFFETPHVASTTPFTNSGVCFSFPDYLVDNKARWDIERINSAFSHIVPNEFGLNETYSGTGFCMGINMSCWNEIGSLDYENFGKGYGEENDWCFRALNAGWRHLLVPNLYINHYHGGSFQSEEKKQLCDKHQLVLKQKYPKLMEYDVPVFQKEDPWSIYRIAAALLLCRDNCVLYIDLKNDDSEVSGASSFSVNRLQELANENVIIAHYTAISNMWELVLYSVSDNIYIKLDDVSDLIQLSNIVDIRKIIINNLAFCTNVEKTINVLSSLKENHTLDVSYYFHDYLSICPSFFLINEKNLPCDPTDYTYCEKCIKNNPALTISRIGIHNWRRRFSELFSIVDSVVFFSYYSKNIVLKIYPEIESKSLVKYHESLVKQNCSNYVPPQKVDVIRIAFVGNFHIHKGAEYFVDLATIFLNSDVPFEFYLVGFNSTDYNLKNITNLGRYDRNNLGKILTENKINLVVYPSFNNETFSYVAQELMDLNVPIVVFSCGAPQERIINSNYQFGEIAETVTLESLCNASIRLIKRLFIDRDDYCQISNSLRSQLMTFCQSPLSYKEVETKTDSLRLRHLATKNQKNKWNGSLARFIEFKDTPTFGVKEALQIYVNKYFPFIFKNTVLRFPLEKRNIGLNEAVRIWLIKKIAS